MRVTTEVARWRQLDWLMLLLAAVLVIYGLLLIYSATYEPIPGEALNLSSFVVRQAVYAAMGFALCGALSLVSEDLLRLAAVAGYLGALAALVAVLVIGHGDDTYGARRWIDLGFLPFQPSEPAKLALILFLSLVLEHDRPQLPLWRLGVSLLATLVPAALIFRQPDLGTSLVLLAIWGGMVVLAGVPLRVLALIGLAGLAALPALWFGLLDYQRSRLLIYLRPESDPFGEGYNILQARLSIGSGGFLGKGLLQGDQTQLHFLRVQHADFIFSVLAEELGFVGAIALFILLLLLILRVLRAADRARNEFGRLVAGGVASMLLFASVVNLGANLTILPVTGIPLPFISHGGSALITNLAALGVLQAVLSQPSRYRF